MLERVIDLFEAPKGWESQIDLYYQLLGDIPADLLAAGAFAVMRDGKFFPKPAEIRAPISGELARRRLAAAKLEIALSRAVIPTADERQPTEDEKRQVDELLASHGISAHPRRGRAIESASLTTADRRQVAAETACFRLPDADSPAAQRRLQTMGEG